MEQIKELFALLAQMNWHRVIKKEFRKWERMQEKADVQRRVVGHLCSEYWEKYPPEKEG